MHSFSKFCRTLVSWGLPCALVALLALAFARRDPELPTGQIRYLVPSDVQAAAEPVRLRRVRTVRLGASARQVKVDGNVLYASLREKGMATVDLARSADNEYAHLVPGSAAPRNGPPDRMILGVSPEPDRLLVLDRRRGLGIYDNSDPHNPVHRWSKLLPGDLRDQPGSIERIGDNYFLPCGGSGLRMLRADFDEETPALSVLRSPYHTRDVYLHGDKWLLVADGSDGGMHVLDIEQADSPVHVAQFLSRGSCNYIEGFDRYVALLMTPVSLVVLDMKEPTQPAAVNYLYRGEGVPICMTSWKERYLIVGYDYRRARGGYVEILDLLDPTNPVSVATIPMPGRAISFDIVEDRLYVSYKTKKQIDFFKIVSDNTNVASEAFGG